MSLRITGGRCLAYGERQLSVEPRCSGAKTGRSGIGDSRPLPREGPLTEPTADARPWRRERVLMPHSSHWLLLPGSSPGRWIEQEIQQNLAHIPAVVAIAAAEREAAAAARFAEVWPHSPRCGKVPM